MSEINLLFEGLLAALVLALVGGLLRVLVGPTRADRMVAVQLLGTSGVAILLLLARTTESNALHDIALVLATLAGVVTLALVRLHGVRAAGR